MLNEPKWYSLRNMFQSLIESIRFESSQSGSSKERTPGEGMHRSGRMTDHGQKQAELKADKKKRRRMGRDAAAAGDGEFNVGKKSGNKVPKHPRKVKPWGSREGYYPPGSTRKGRHRQRMQRNDEALDFRDIRPKPKGRSLGQRVKDAIQGGQYNTHVGDDGKRTDYRDTRAQRRTRDKADDKRRSDNFAKSQESLKKAVGRIKTRH